MLYRDVKRKLITDISSGAVPPGGALANESDLAKRFGVSVGTVRRAVDELVADHILLRQQGRGTFVGRLDRERFMFQFFKIVMRDRPPEFPAVKLLSLTKSRATAAEGRLLELAVGAVVFRISNVLSLHGRPLMHDSIVLDASLFAGLTKAQFEKRPSTIYELYQTAFGVTVVGAEERVQAVAIRGDSAGLLGLKEGSPVLRIERIAFTFNQKPAELRVSIVDTQDADYVSRLVGQT
jgi:GntR family transcriptional regulator